MLKKSILSLLLCIVSVWGSYAQQLTIKGNLVDTTLGVYLENTSVILINQADSILRANTRADADGNFTIIAPDTGRYMILINHPEFATYTDRLKITENTELGDVYLVTKRNLLEEVVVSSRLAITIKGDTVEYAADSFNVKEYDNVDELLKKLPGLEVSKDGSITAHGAKVQKMYVDGEEFFSDDPAVLAKTLKASSIDRVQVYDDKSENAKNTGIDDGEKVKTINLTLKEDAKKGTMGRVGAGYAINDYYQGEAIINNFQGKRKFSAYLMGGNTNNNNLSWQDRMSMGGGGFEMSEDGGMSMESMSFDNFEAGGQGLPKALNGGLHYSDKYFQDKVKLNTNYSYNNRIVDRINNSTTQYILPDTQYFNINGSESQASNLSNALTIRSTWDIDSSSSITLRANGSLNRNENESNSNTRAEDINHNLVNRSTVYNQAISNGKNFNGNLIYRKKFKKEGRSMSLGLSGSQVENDQESRLISNNYLVATNMNIDYNQNKYNLTDNNQFGVQATYTEPLVKNNVFLELNYRYSQNRNESNNKTYDLDAAGNETYNDRFSNHYKFNYNMNRGGVAFRYNKNKINASIGGDMANTNFEQINYTRSELSRTYNQQNFFPRATFRYKINTYSSFDFRYNGATQQPTIDQIQPIVINTDPTNIRIGNPNLEQQFNHSINISYNTYSVLKGQFVYAGIFGNANQNPIVQAQTIDETGIRTYQFVNAKASQMYSAWGGFNKKFNDNFKFDLRASGSYNRNYNYTNGLENLNNTYNIAPTIGLQYETDTTIFIKYSFTPNYYNSVASIRKDVDQSYWNYRHSLEFEFELPFNIFLESDVNWHLRPQANANVQGSNVFLWNVALSKRFLKDRSLEAKIYAYDILNQNVGYNYYQGGDYINESSYGVIKQYFMLNLTWHFNSMGAPQTNNSRRFRH